MTCSMNLVSAIFFTTLIGLTAGHSQLTEPESNAPMTCRLGGEPQFGVETCEGPCDMRAVNGGYAIHDSNSNPAATYQRGQRFNIKYSRNNHAPGGFYRLTLVKPDKMMDKREHDKNAFYYSCWGGNAVKAASSELGKREYGYSFIGSDSEQHDLDPGYYTATVTMPRVVPDGDYVMGWVWYGGSGGGEVENNGPATKEPSPYGYFSDYWSCSYVRVEGGDALEGEHTPVFNNDMTQFSAEGCMSANDSPGVCSYEPCSVTGKYQKPRPFQDGNTPRALTPADFGGETPTTNPPTTGTPTTTVGNPGSMSEQDLVRRRCCRCLDRSTTCWKKLAERTLNYCSPYKTPGEQPSICKEACCVFCKSRPWSKVCAADNVKNVCML